MVTEVEAATEAPAAPACSLLVTFPTAAVVPIAPPALAAIQLLVISSKRFVTKDVLPVKSAKQKEDQLTSAPLSMFKIMAVLAAPEVPAAEGAMVDMEQVLQGLNREGNRVKEVEAVNLVPVHQAQEQVMVVTEELEDEGQTAEPVETLVTEVPVLVMAQLVTPVIKETAVIKPLGMEAVPARVAKVLEVRAPRVTA